MLNRTMTRRSFGKCVLAATGATAMLAATGMTGCGSSAKYKAGTYEAAFEGKDGPVPVTVTFSDNEIESVEIGENKESQKFGAKAIEQLPPEIIKAQSADVDAVSGATLTSNAIIQGVESCIKDASK